jgi:anthranilate synthase/aminodeoxychorismate synthase-like glutamine amidotransferase
MILMIDNYDSFTYNLVQYLGEMGHELVVHRNDRITVEQCLEYNPDCIVISPGPGAPSSAGISIELIKRSAGITPILGVCLGHQAIGEAFGGKIVHAPRIMHGKESMIFHDSDDLFMEIANPFRAIRYHSLVIDPGSFPDDLVKIAWTDQEEIMGVKHREHPIYGIQFHPESILTDCGKQILENFIEIGGSHVTDGIDEGGRGTSPDPTGNGRGNGRHHER